MFQVLIAKLNFEGKWSRVAVLRANSKGKVSLPESLQGQSAGYVAKNAAQFFANEDGACQLEYSIPGGLFRATKISAKVRLPA